MEGWKGEEIGRRCEVFEEKMGMLEEGIESRMGERGGRVVRSRRGEMEGWRGRKIGR